MNGINILAQVWKLHTHPFAPETDPEGKHLDPHWVEVSLDPVRFPEVASLYFPDVYQWNEGTVGLKTLEGVHFPDLDELASSEDTLVMIVSGYNNSGLRSMVNMLRYRSQEQGLEPALIVKARLGDFNKAEWTKTIVQLLIDQYGSPTSQPTYEELKNIYNEESDQLEKKPEGYLRLPQRVHNKIRQHSSRPFVFVLDERENLIYERWKTLYEIARGLYNLLIIPTRKSNDARTFYNSLKNQISVVHVEARMLNQQMAQRYLLQRLTLFRPAGPPAGLPPTAPFSEEALQYLYARGSQTRLTDPITFPIGRLNKAFRRAIHLKAMQLQQISQQGSSVTDLPSTQKLIQRELIDQVNADINQHGLY